MKFWSLHLCILKILYYNGTANIYEQRISTPKFKESIARMRTLCSAFLNNNNWENSMRRSTDVSDVFCVTLNRGQFFWCNHCTKSSIPYILLSPQFHVTINIQFLLKKMCSISLHMGKIKFYNLCKEYIF